MIGYGKHLLVVDEVETTRLLLPEVLGQEGFTVAQACDGVQALREMQQRHFDVVVTDYHMPRLTGLDLLRQSQMAWPEIPVIIFSAIEWEIRATRQTPEEPLPGFVSHLIPVFF